MPAFFSPTARRLSRRGFLRGAGVTLALPMLDAMTPAFARVAEPKSPRRLVAIQTNMGLVPKNFFPEGEGKETKLSPYLDIIKAHRDQFTAFSGVSHPDVDGGHEAERTFLTATPHPGNSGFKSTISLDQFAVEKLGPVTRFPSFALSINAEAVQGMVFARSGVKVPTEKSPAALYRQMFVQGTAAEVQARLDDLQQGRSLLDSVSESAKRLGGKVGPADRDRLDQYYSAVRDLEKQLELGQAWEKKPKPKTKATQPLDIADPRKLIERIRLMLDVAKLGLESDSTRLITLFINTFSVVPEIPGVLQETHSLTHHGNRPEILDQLFKIESAHFKALDAFLTGLAETKEAGDSLLNRTMVLFGAPMGNASNHSNVNLPILLAGGGFKHQGHLKFDVKKNYPLPNLYVSMLQKMGVEADKFATSTGTMRGLS